MFFVLTLYNFFTLFFLFTCYMSAFAQSPESFCKYENAKIKKFNQNIYCLTDLSNSTQRYGFVQSVPFNQRWKDNTVKVLIEACKQFTFLNRVKDAGQPYPMKTDILNELIAINNSHYSSDWLFQSAISSAVILLRDAHSTYYKPSCYSGTFNIPINLVASLSDDGSIQYKLKISSYVVLYELLFPGFRNKLTQFVDKEIVKINNIATDNYLDTFADESSISNDLNVRKNAAIINFAMRNVRSFNLPDAYTYTLSFKDGTNISMPVVIYDMALSNQFNPNKECVVAQSTSTRTTTSKIKITSDPMDPLVEHKKHIEQFPHVQQFVDDAKYRHRVLESSFDGTFAKQIFLKNSDSKIECFNTTDKYNRSILIMKIPTFAPIDCGKSFIDAYHACLAQPYDAIIIDVIRNSGGLIGAQTELSYLLFEYFNKNPTKMSLNYDFIHSTLNDESIPTLNYYYNQLVYTNYQNPKRNYKGFDNFTELYLPGREVLEGDTITKRSNLFSFPLGVCNGGATNGWKPRKFYDSSNLFILTDGTCGSACSLFTKLIHEYKFATFIGLGANWGQSMDISSFASNTESLSKFDQYSFNMAFLTSATFGIAFASPYSTINKNKKLQFMLHEPQIRLPFWDFDRPDDGNKTNTNLLLSKLYDQVMNDLIPLTITSSPPVSSPVTLSCASSKYSDTQVILIGVLPSCLLFVLVVVPLLIYICMISGKRKEQPGVITKELEYHNVDTEVHVQQETANENNI